MSSVQALQYRSVLEVRTKTISVRSASEVCVFLVIVTNYRNYFLHSVNQPELVAAMQCLFVNMKLFC